ncbi:dentin sialophosphoprotein-like [Trichogramma pretiosum]|uniref:dentin sialophosphoprotein-like n=1 Tax=Trichogramma pretiosum TaxID=7493 RepID=UPI0006C98BE5|nr:dentin sialophosphoprotein-like [Trichogramma pretiosum]
MVEPDNQDSSSAKEDTNNVDTNPLKRIREEIVDEVSTISPKKARVEQIVNDDDKLPSASSDNSNDVDTDMTKSECDKSKKCEKNTMELEEISQTDKNDSDSNEKKEIVEKTDSITDLNSGSNEVSNEGSTSESNEKKIEKEVENPNDCAKVINDQGENNVDEGEKKEESSETNDNEKSIQDQNVAMEVDETNNSEPTALETAISDDQTKKNDGDDIQEDAQKNEDNLKNSSKEIGTDPMITDNEPKEDSAQNSIKIKSIPNKQIINGIELIVECASDNESIESNKKDNDIKPRKNTVIFYEMPVEGEVDCTSSEDEKQEPKEKIAEDDNNETSENNSEDSNKKLQEEKDSQKSVSPKNISSVETSPSTQKSPNSKKSPEGAKSSSQKSPTVELSSPPKQSSLTETSSSPQKSLSPEEPLGTPEPPLKKRRGRPPKSAKKIILKKEVKHQEQVEEKTAKDEKDASHKNDKMDIQESNDNNELLVSDLSGSDTESDKIEKADEYYIKKIEKLKKLIRLAGIKLYNYKIICRDCKTDADRAKRLQTYLEGKGIQGRITAEKCIQLKKKNQELKVKELENVAIEEPDKSSNVSEGRMTRRSRRTEELHQDTK